MLTFFCTQLFVCSNINVTRNPQHSCRILTTTNPYLSLKCLEPLSTSPGLCVEGSVVMLMLRYIMWSLQRSRPGEFCLSRLSQLVLILVLSEESQTEVSYQPSPTPARCVLSSSRARPVQPCSSPAAAQARRRGRRGRLAAPLLPPPPPTPGPGPGCCSLLTVRYLPSRVTIPTTSPPRSPQRNSTTTR